MNDQDNRDVDKEESLCDSSMQNLSLAAELRSLTRK